MEKALIGSIIDLPRPAREAVINWASNMVIQISIAEQQKELDKLKGETKSYVEDTSIGVG